VFLLAERAADEPGRSRGPRRASGVARSNCA